jgi:hypothetical protein
VFEDNYYNIQSDIFIVFVFVKYLKYKYSSLLRGLFSTRGVNFVLTVL